MILVKYTPQRDYQGTPGYFFSTDEAWLHTINEAKSHFAVGDPPLYDQDQEVYFSTYANWLSCFTCTVISPEDAELIIKLLGPRMGSTFTHF